MLSVIEPEVVGAKIPSSAQEAQSQAIAQRLAQFQQTMALIHSLPNHRAEAGLGPLPDDAIADAYDEQEGIRS